MSKHTDGPWAAIRDDNSKDRFGNNYWIIEPVDQRDDEKYLRITGWMSKDNAKLIAMAPAMYNRMRQLEAEVKICKEVIREQDRKESILEKAIYEIKELEPLGADDQLTPIVIAQNAYDEYEKEGDYADS